MIKLILQGTRYRVSEGIRGYLETKLSALTRLSNQILDARVELAFDQTIKEGQPFRAEINLRVPRELLRAEATGGSILEAIDLMLEEVRRQLLAYQEKRRALSKHPGLLLSPLSFIPTPYCPSL